MHVPDGERMAMVVSVHSTREPGPLLPHTHLRPQNRWAPWWLSVQDFGGGHVGYMSLEEWEALPLALQPLVRHLCPDAEDKAQQALLDRSQAASDRTTWGFQQYAPSLPTCCFGFSVSESLVFAQGARGCERLRVECARARAACGAD